MSEFLFAKSQRVILPTNIAGAEDVQAVIKGNSAELGREPVYRLQWPSSDAVQENGQLVPCEATVSESELVAAQPPKMIPHAEVEKLRAEAYRQGADDLREEMEKERQSRIAKRKNSRKSAARKRSR